MNPDKINIQGGWKQYLTPFLCSDDFKKIIIKLKEDHLNGKKILPASNNWWKPFNCNYDDLKVVIIADGPHKGFKETKDGFISLADGLPFSTGFYNGYEKLIEDYWYAGIEQDIFDGMNLNMFLNPDLSFLVEQGVLLLNSSITTTETDSHFSLWKPFIAYLIQHVLNSYPMKLLFLLIGEEAWSYKSSISSDHHVLECEHPEVAIIEKRAWDFNNIFSKTNRFLKTERNEEITWVEEFSVYK